MGRPACGLVGGVGASGENVNLFCSLVQLVGQLPNYFLVAFINKNKNLILPSISNFVINLKKGII